jgi:hypothetical protein
MAESPRSQDQIRTDFIMAEHASLQEKIRHASTDLYRTETIIPLAIAFTYAWLYSREPIAQQQIPQWIWWVPVVAAIYGAVRQRIRYRSLWAHHEYVSLIEREFYGPKPKREDGRIHGWETYWLKDANRFHKIRRWKVSSHGLMRITYWAVLVAGTVALAVHHSSFNILVWR